MTIKICNICKRPMRETQECITEIPVPIYEKNGSNTVHSLNVRLDYAWGSETDICGTCINSAIYQAILNIKTTPEIL